MVLLLHIVSAVPHIFFNTINFNAITLHIISYQLQYRQQQQRFGYVNFASVYRTMQSIKRIFVK